MLDNEHCGEPLNDFDILKDPKCKANDVNLRSELGALARGSKNAKCWKLGIEDYDEDYNNVTPPIENMSSEY